jgi:hypothetical protein
MEKNGRSIEDFGKRQELLGFLPCFASWKGGVRLCPRLYADLDSIRVLFLLWCPQAPGGGSAALARRPILKHGAAPAFGRAAGGLAACRSRGSWGDNTRRPVSRVLSPRLRGMDGHSSGMAVARHLTRPTRTGRGRRLPDRSGTRPYLVLLPVGFALPPLLPEARCAFTAPFHPFPESLYCRGGLFSVALSLGSPPPGITRHRSSVEPGLSSTMLPSPQPSSRLVPVS